MKTASDVVSRFPGRWVILLFIAVVWVGCGDDDGASDGVSGDYEVDERVMLNLDFSPDPPEVGATELWMELRVDGAPYEGADFVVEPWMPSHGHGSNTHPVALDEGDGLYWVDDLVFTMAGHWELLIEVEYEDSVAELVVDLEVDG